MLACHSEYSDPIWLIRIKISFWSRCVGYADCWSTCGASKRFTPIVDHNCTGLCVICRQCVLWSANRTDWRLSAKFRRTMSPSRAAGLRGFVSAGKGRVLCYGVQRSSFRMVNEFQGRLLNVEIAFVFRTVTWNPSSRSMQPRKSLKLAARI